MRLFIIRNRFIYFIFLLYITFTFFLFLKERRRIANNAVTDARKKIKNVINLDTNVQIKLDFINPESAEKFIEKGWVE